MVTCPLNSEHYVPADNFEKHVTLCSWRMEGYSEEDIPLPESCGPGESGIAIGISYLEYTLYDSTMNPLYITEVD